MPPDREGTAWVSSPLGEIGEVLARHPGGRPWVIGRQHHGNVRHLGSGTRRAVVLGDCLGDTRGLGPGEERLLDVALTLPGSFYVVLAGPSGLVAAGDVTGVRRVFTTRVRDVPVVASHAVILRGLTGAPVDRRWLACRLASPASPSVVTAELSPFEGVASVPPGHLVETTGAGFRTERWWSPPPATDSLEVGAVALREALTTAVGARIERTEGQVSVALSGGSTRPSWPVWHLRQIRC